MSFKDYLKEQFTLPTLKEIKKNIRKDSKRLAVLCFWIIVYIVGKISSEVGIIPYILAPLTLGFGVTLTLLTWVLKDDYEQWRRCKA